VPVASTSSYKLKATKSSPPARIPPNRIMVSGLKPLSRLGRFTAGSIEPGKAKSVIARSPFAEAKGSPRY
jgi:hypothetical protein